MHQPSFSWTDSRLDATQAGTGRCVAVLGYDGFSYAITDAQRQLQAIRSWNFSSLAAAPKEVEAMLEDILATETMLSLPYATKALALATPWVTLMPERLLMKNALPTYFNLLLPEQLEPLQYGVEPITEGNMVAVYAVEQTLFQLGARLMKDAVTHALCAVLVPDFGKITRGNNHTVVLHVRGYRGYISVFERANLFYYNSFQFEQPEDFLYFTLLAYEQLRMNTQEVHLFMSGDILDTGALYKILYRYVHTLSFLPPPDSLNWPGAQIGAPSHQFQDLLLLAASA